MKKDLIDNFIMHPDWKEMEEFIVKHFEHETDVTTINTDLDSSVIHAEVIARQRIGADIKSLQASFSHLKEQRNKQRVSYE